MTSIVAAIAMLLLLRLLPARPVDDHPFFHGLRTPLVIAHRGSVVLWPENTLYGFERALALGADVIETDVRITADGVPVLLHDPTLNRTTNGRGPVRAVTLAELATLDAGHGWTPDEGRSFPYRAQGLTVPTLEALFQQWPLGRMNLEIKEDDPALVDAVCRAIRQHGMQERVLVVSFFRAAMLDFRRRCPGVATSATAGEVRDLFVLSTLGVGHLYRPAAKAIQAPEYTGALRLLNPRLIAAARRLRLHVHAFTINDEAEVRRLLDLGLDGIITDRPDRMRALLRPASGAP